MLAPGACSAWAIRSAADEVGPRRVVGDHDHFARPGDRVDVDVAVDVLLGQRHEQVARARRSCRPAECPRRRRPAPPRPAPRRGDRPRGCPARGRWPAGRRLYAPNGVGGATTASCCTPAACAGTAVISTVEGYAAAPPGTQMPTRSKRQVALPQVAAVRPRDRHVVGQERLLKLEDVLADAADRCQKRRVGRRVGGRQLGGRDAQRLGRQLRPCRSAPSSRAPPPGPAARTSPQIRSTTSGGESGSPKTSIVRRRPASLTTLPRGLSARAARPRPRAASAWRLSMRWMLKRCGAHADSLSGSERRIGRKRRHWSRPCRPGYDDSQACEPTLATQALHFVRWREPGKAQTAAGQRPRAKNADEALDFRSDTVTKPTPAMRAAMAAAEVGDDVFGEDPTVHALQAADRRHAGQGGGPVRPLGHDVEPDRRARALRARATSSSARPAATSTTTSRAPTPSSAAWRRAPSRARTACCGSSSLTGLIRGDNEHLVRTRLVCLENTHNRGAGRVQPYDDRRGDLQLGACQRPGDASRRRAAVQRRRGHRHRRPPTGPQHFDTVSVCFSKGLGAPVGSALAGPKDLIASGPPASQAVRRRHAAGRRHRRRGALCARASRRAAGRRPRQCAACWPTRSARSTGWNCRPTQVDTNIVIFRVEPALGTAAEFCRAAARRRAC